MAQPIHLDLPTALGPPVASGLIRQTPEDYQVSEEPICEPAGEGEHSWLYVRKRNANTDWVSGQLAGHAKVSRRQVSYAGLKDRMAVTEQWFSVHLPGKPDPDWTELNCAEFQVLASKRHHRKLRRGGLKGNHFKLCVRQLQGDREAIDQRLSTIVELGVPNYFGAQRFGRGGANLEAAQAMFSGTSPKSSRHQRGLYLSAARSMLFNRVLSKRVSEGLWNQLLEGDVMQLDARRSWFVAEDTDPSLRQRLDALEIHPTGPLWGKGVSPAATASLAFEQLALDSFATWMRALEAAGLEQDRRALRMRVRELDWEYPHADVLELRFALPAGSYGNVLLREILGPDR